MLDKLTSFIVIITMCILFISYDIAKEEYENKVHDKKEVMQVQNEAL